MPTYEYSCSQCGRYEVFQRISEEPLETCSKCGGSAKRLISASAGIIFKGSGFHTTDYRSGDYKDKAKQETSPSETKKEETGAKKKEEANTVSKAS